MTKMQMKSTKQCKRIKLAGSDSCRVVFCESCNVAELEMGALSLRLEPSALLGLTEVLQEAGAALAILEAAEMQHNLRSGAGHVH